MDAVICNGLTKSYGKVKALDNLSFKAENGAMFGLIGPDGAGKTTFMKIASCLMKQDSGMLEISGYNNLSHPYIIRNRIGYMPQHFSLYPDLTVNENLIFFADLFGISKTERKSLVTYLLEFSRLQPFSNRKAGDLSGGMKQKLALSCTLIHKPDVLFLDEPTTGVDPVSRREFRDILAKLRAEGTTILISTPYMDEAENCDRIGFISSGKLLAEGRPADFKSFFPKVILTIHGDDIVKNTRKLTFPPCVIDLNAFGDRVHVIVDNRNSAMTAIQEFLNENGIKNFIIEEKSPSIEDVFMERMRNG